MSSSPPTRRKYVSLVAFVGVCFAVAASGAFFPPDDWYRSLNRPSYAPPNWVFGPVWTILYLMIAVSGWLVWSAQSERSKRPAMIVFAIQLALNAVWSALFFGLHSPGWALFEICLLWAAILSTMVSFSSHSRLAARLLLPYFGWVSFAAFLNYGFWSLNS